MTNNNHSREQRTIRIAKWIGAIGGCWWGLLVLIGKVIGFGPGAYTEGRWGLAFIVSIPSAVIGAYVGMKVVEKLTKVAIKGSRKLAMALLKGVGFGAIAGAIILIISWEIFYILSYYLGILHFKSEGIIYIVTAVLAMGLVVGGMIGAVAGLLLGLFFYFYLR